VQFAGKKELKMLVRFVLRILTGQIAKNRTVWSKTGLLATLAFPIVFSEFSLPSSEIHSMIVFCGL